MGPSLGLGLVLAAVLMVGAGQSRVQAQSTENAEARAFFDQGNRAFERSQRVMGSARRQELLEEALAAYVSSLAIVRSKNALFNAGVTLAALGRAAEAYSYFGEYLALPGLTEEERRAGDEQRAALLGRVMMVSVRSTAGKTEKGPLPATSAIDRRQRKSPPLPAASGATAISRVMPPPFFQGAAVSAA